MSKFIQIVLISAICCSGIVSILAQEITLTGVIQSADTQELLIGATIISNETATTTDLEGGYTISKIKQNDTLDISYVGYERRLIIVDKTIFQMQELNVLLERSKNLLNTATITSGKYDKALGEITVSVEILKPQLLEDVNATSLDQVLEKVPGVTIIDGQPNIRGGSGFSYGAGSRVLLLIDDIPALQSDAGFPNWDDIPIELTNQIEVLKGASSALFGSSAMNGIINLRTDFAKEKRETKIASFATLYNSPQDNSKKWWGNAADTLPADLGMYITHKQKYGKLDVVSSIYLRRHMKWNMNSYDIYGRGALGLRYRLNRRWTVGANANYREGKNSNFFYWAGSDSLAMTGNPNTFSVSNSTRFLIDPYVQYADEKGNRHKLLSRYYNVKNKVQNNQSNFSSLLYGEYQYQKRFLKADLVLTSGLVASYSTIDAELYSSSTFTSNNLAVYAQADKAFFERFNVSLGLRYERNQIVAPDSIPINNVQMAAGMDTEAKPVFRLGANYQLAEFTYVRANYGQGYRFPTIAEKYISTQVGFPISPNLDLKSESGWSAEIGVKQGFKVRGFNGMIDLAIFQTDYSEMMEFTFSNNLAIGFQSQNIGNTKIRGVDFNVAGSGRILSILPINALIGYTYLDPKFKVFGEREMNSSSSTDNILKYRYQHTGKLDIASDYKKFNIGVAGFYYSNMDAIDRLFEFLIPGLQDYRANNNTAFSIWNVRVSYAVTPNLKASIHINNMLNQEYTLRPALIEPPRNFTLRIDMSL